MSNLNKMINKIEQKAFEKVVERFSANYEIFIITKNVHDIEYKKSLLVALDNTYKNKYNENYISIYREIENKTEMIESLKNKVYSYFLAIHLNKILSTKEQKKSNILKI